MTTNTHTEGLAQAYEWVAAAANSKIPSTRKCGELLGIALAELAQARAEIGGAHHELSCCDDIPLDKGLATGIGALQTDREHLRTEVGRLREKLRGHVQ